MDLEEFRPEDHLPLGYWVDLSFVAQFDGASALLPRKSHLKDSPRAEVRHCLRSLAWMVTRAADAKSLLVSSVSAAMLRRNCCSRTHPCCLVSRKTLSGSS